MALRAAAFGHFFGKLLAVRVVMALRANLFLHLQRDARLWRGVACATWRRDMFAVEHKRRRRMFSDAK